MCIFSLTCISIYEWMTIWVTIQRDFISQTVLSVATGSSFPSVFLSHTFITLSSCSFFPFFEHFFFSWLQSAPGPSNRFFFSAPSSNLTQWMWVWANSRRQWRTGKPGVLLTRVTKSRAWLSNWTTATSSSQPFLQGAPHPLTGEQD